MSALTNSIASRWSGVSVYGNASSNSRCQSVSGGNAWPSRRLRSAYRLSSSPASSWAARRARALIVLPARAAELRQRRVSAAGADVAADLGQLVDRHEHPVRAGVLQVQVVAGDAGDGLGVEAGEPRDARGPRGRRCRRCAGRRSCAARRGGVPVGPLAGAAPAAAEQPVLGDHRQVELRGDEAGLQPGAGEGDLPGSAGRRRPRRSSQRTFSRPRL